MSSYTRPDGKYGPTRTKTVMKRFEQRLRGVLARINARLREGIIKDDILNLRGEQDTLEVEDPGPFETDDSRAAIVKFIQWLREQLNEEFLTVVSNDQNEFIRSSYLEGVRLATTQLQEADVNIQDVDIESIVEDNRFSRGLQTLYTRTYENLESVSDAVVSDVRDELLQGWRDGENPTKIANRLTERVDSIGKHRATLIARSEIMNAAADGFVERVDQTAEDLDVEVGVQHVGRLTAMDEDVCPACRRLGDEVFTTDEFRSATFEFRGKVYRVGIPSHPNGRCAPVAKVGVSQDDLAPLSERVPGRLIST